MKAKESEGAKEILQGGMVSDPLLCFLPSHIIGKDSVPFFGQRESA